MKIILILIYLKLINSKIILKNNLICKKELISIFQSLKCKEGQIGIGINCSCSSSSSSLENNNSCKISTLTSFLPSFELFQDNSLNSTFLLCDDIFSNLLNYNIYSKSSFLRSHGYPLDINSEICKQKEELAEITIRRYHPCSVSIGKFLRYNSLFQYNLFGRGTRVHGYNGKSHTKDTLVDFYYDEYPWRWSQGISECEKLNLTSWNCAFSDFSSYYHYYLENNQHNSENYYSYEIPCNNNNDNNKDNNNNKDNDINNILREEIIQQNEIKKSKKFMRNKNNKDKNNNEYSRELLEKSSYIESECESNFIQYKNVELLKGSNLIKLIRDIRLNRPNHISQFLLYGKILVLLSRPSDPVWNYLKKNLVFLSNGEYSETKLEELIKLMSNVRNGHYFPPIYQTIKHNSKNIRRRVISVSMHVRQGDSCDYMVKYELPPQSKYLSSKSGERPCYHVDVYMKKLYLLKQKYGVNRVYLATDSHEMIKRAQSEKDFEWIYLNISRHIFGSSDNSNIDLTNTDLSSSTNSYNNKMNKFHNKKWVDFYSNSYNSIVTFSGVIDLFLMKFGDIFLGAFTSHYSKLSYYLMIGTKMKLLPFISLDYPLSCDTVNDCTHEEINQINPTILDIINWAPECRRINDNGWMQSERDPCGIYL